MKLSLFLTILAALPLSAAELVNADFNRFNAGVPAGWRETTEAVELKAAPPAGITVQIRRAGVMDDVSRGVLVYLLAERPAGLTLLTVDGCTLVDMPSGK